MNISQLKTKARHISSKLGSSARCGVEFCLYVSLSWHTYGVRQVGF